MSDPVKQIVAVDPGLNGCGLAILDRHGYVEHAEYVRSPLTAAAELPYRWERMAVCVGEAVAKATKLPRGEINRTLIVEMPKIYPAARQAGDPNDIVNLAGVVAAVVALSSYEAVRLVYPRDWKGTIDADEMIEKRIKPRLFPVEVENVHLPTAEKLQHNVYDAVGIGLFVVGRLEAKKVIAR